jgi:hypothetical protein
MNNPNKVKELAAHIILAAFSVVIVFILPGCSPNAGSDAINNINNPGFEDGTNQWTLGTNATRDTTYQHSGSACLRLEPEALDASYADQRFDITVGDNVTANISFYARTLTSGGKCKIEFTFWDISNIALGGTIGSAMMPSTTYLYLESPIPIPAGTVSVSVRVINKTVDPTPSTDTIFVDDLKFVMSK